MIRIILGIIVGFVVWSILWVGSDQLLIATIDWYGAHQLAFQKAMIGNTAFEPNMTVLLMNLVRSVAISFIAGFVTAVVAKENRRSTLILGIILLAFGLMVELIAWHYLPVWYHFLFLFLLIPVTMLGGRMKKSN